jgi:hypothetical protein
MKEIASITTTIMEDRGFKKVRVNMVKNDKIFGFIKPI